MNAQDKSPRKEDYHVIYLRRRSRSEWLAGFIWLIVLAILLEYTLQSFNENEGQATVLAGALFLGLLLAGVTIQVMRGVEAQSRYRNERPVTTRTDKDDQAT